MFLVFRLPGGIFSPLINKKQKTFPCFTILVQCGWTTLRKDKKNTRFQLRIHIGVIKKTKCNWLIVVEVNAYSLTKTVVTIFSTRKCKDINASLQG